MIREEMRRGPGTISSHYATPYEYEEDLPTEGVHQLAVLLAVLSVIHQGKR